MKNILIISSKKYTKLKTYTELLELLKVMKITYNTVYIEDSNVEESDINESDIDESDIDESDIDENNSVDSDNNEDSDNE